MARQEQALVDGAHHLEILTPERALALLRAGADVRAALTEGHDAGPSPLELAQEAEAAGGAKEGTAAFLVLEAASRAATRTSSSRRRRARAQSR